jgi:3-oxoacyl-[acyl-carrier protein] reductase
MSDLLVDLSQQPLFRQTVKQLGVPLPMPQKLERPEGPWVERPLADRAVVVGGTEGGSLLGAVAATLARSGANPLLVGVDPSPFAAAGEAWGRPPRALGADEVVERAHALLFDASGIDDPAGLRALYDFFQPRLGELHRCGRVIVLGRPHGSEKKPARAAAQRALEGFVRSVGREVGRKGATAMFVTVAEGAEDRLGPVLRFLLSPRSAYISGQHVHVSKTVRNPGDRPVRPLEGKVALVTGAARGIGEATAHQLAARAPTCRLDRPDDERPQQGRAAPSAASRALDGHHRRRTRERARHSAGAQRSASAAST